MSAAFSRDLYLRAWHFAAARHNGQKVPGSELPYITHVGAVAMEVLATLALDDVASPDLAVACALLHDTVEDTETTAGEIAEAFGVAVADGVRALSKDRAIPKADQMADSLRRIQAQPREIWIVKLADRTVKSPELEHVLRRDAAARLHSSRRTPADVPERCVVTLRPASSLL